VYQHPAIPEASNQELSTTACLLKFSVVITVIHRTTGIQQKNESVPQGIVWKQGEAAQSNPCNFLIDGIHMEE
jgi:hypothetical protein